MVRGVKLRRPELPDQYSTKARPMGRSRSIPYMDSLCGHTFRPVFAVYRINQGVCGDLTPTPKSDRINPERIASLGKSIFGQNQMCADRTMPAFYAEGIYAGKSLRHPVISGLSILVGISRRPHIRSRTRTGLRRADMECMCDPQRNATSVTIYIENWRSGFWRGQPASLGESTRLDS